MFRVLLWLSCDRDIHKLPYIVGAGWLQHERNAPPSPRLACMATPIPATRRLDSSFDVKPFGNAARGWRGRRDPRLSPVFTMDDPMAPAAAALRPRVGAIAHFSFANDRLRRVACSHDDRGTGEHRHERASLRFIAGSSSTRCRAARVTYLRATYLVYQWSRRWSALHSARPRKCDVLRNFGGSLQQG